MLTLAYIDFVTLLTNPIQEMTQKETNSEVAEKYKIDLTKDTVKRLKYLQFQVRSKAMADNLTIFQKLNFQQKVVTVPANLNHNNLLDAPQQEKKKDKTEINSVIQKSDQESSDVILNAYMRSGSTILGKLLGHRKDTFYLFEPLWKVAKFQFYKGPDHICHYFRPYCSNLTNEIEREDAKLLNESLNYLQSILNCSFHNYAQFFIDTDFKEFQNESHDWVFHKGMKWQNYKICRQNSSENLKTCLQAAEPSCMSAQHKMIKLLRMTFDNLELLLQKNQRLKIIELLRDPRAIINSHVNTGWFGFDPYDPGFIIQDAGVTCQRMMHDLRMGKLLQHKYPGRIKFIQYEDVGDIKNEKVKKLYTFLGMEYTMNEEKLIRKLEKPNRHADKKGFHPYNYRKTLSWEIIKVVDKQCSEVLEELGYHVYRNEEHLRDLSQPAAVSPLPYSL